MTRFVRDWGPAILWTAVIFALSSRPTLPVDLSSGLDKVAHLGAYTVLGVLLARGQARSRILVVWAFVLGLLLGALDEYHQSFVPGRSTELADWIADALGILIGILLYHLWCQRWASRGWPVRRDLSEPVPHE